VGSNGPPSRSMGEARITLGMGPVRVIMTPPSTEAEIEGRSASHNTAAAERGPPSRSMLMLLSAASSLERAGSEWWPIPDTLRSSADAVLWVSCDSLRREGVFQRSPQGSWRTQQSHAAPGHLDPLPQGETSSRRGGRKRTVTGRGCWRQSAQAASLCSLSATSTKLNPPPSGASPSRVQFPMALTSKIEQVARLPPHIGESLETCPI